MFSGLLIPVVIVGLALAVVSLVALFSRRYKRCAPNEVLVVYGRKRMIEIIDPTTGDKSRIERGYRLIIGGATFVMPVLERVQRIVLNTFQVPFSVSETPNVDGVLVTVDALANMKVSSDPELLSAAVERLLEMGTDQVHQICETTLEGQLRQIVGTLTVEDIVTDREKISQQVLDVARGELNKLGFQLDNFVVQRITDNEGYIDALGKKRTAEVKRDAEIAEAEAHRDASVRSADARREGETAQAVAQQAISDANRARDVRIAENDASVQAEQARIEVRAETARAQESKAYKVAEVAAEEAEVEARTRLQEKERERKDAELRASVIVSAEREKEARIIRANAEQEAAQLEGEARRILAEKAGQGEQAKLTAEAEGRKAAAAALEREKQAEAEGQRAMLLAQAEGTKAQGEAEGAAKLALLHAEAKGLEEKNAALASLSAGARAVITLELLPGIIEHAGEAGEKIAAAVFENLGMGLSKIDEVRIVDLGGNGNDSSTPIARFAGSMPEVAFGFLQKLGALGIDVDELLEKAGIDLSGLVGGALTERDDEVVQATGAEETYE